MNSNISIDEKKLARLKMNIYAMERRNLKRKKPLSDTGMITRIIKEIESEVNKCY